MKDDDPDFWFELTQKRAEDLVPKESEPQVEDSEEASFDGEDDCAVDDSDVPLTTVISSIITGEQPKNLHTRKNGTFKSTEDVGLVDEVVSGKTEEKIENLGRGERIKTANRSYIAFWRHDDNDGSDKEEEN